MTRVLKVFRGERGSLPLALLVTIIVAGVVVVLIARTASSQRQVQYDQSFHGALPAADAAAEVAKFRLNNEMMLRLDDDSEDGTETEPGEFEVDQQTVEETGEVEGRTFVWSMTRKDGYWEVDSTALDERGRRDVSRRVRSRLEDRPAVSTAAFADVLFRMSGANTADSYNSETLEWCTGRGIVASNEIVGFEGQASPATSPCEDFRPQGRTVDWVVLYDWDEDEVDGITPEFPAGERCGRLTGPPNNPSINPDHENCKYIEFGDDEFLDPELLEESLNPTVDDATAFIEKGLEACKSDPSETLDDFRSTDDGTVLTPAPDSQPEVDGLFPGLSGHYYCYNDVFIDDDTTITGASQKDPVIIFVEGDLQLAKTNPQGNPNQPVSVGCGTNGCPLDISVVDGQPMGTEESSPEAGRLWIFVLGGEVGVRASSEFAGVIWAPGSLCSGLGSSAQVDFYGSLVCEKVSNNGGWRFHYDEKLGEITDGRYVRTRWEELELLN